MTIPPRQYPSDSEVSRRYLQPTPPPLILAAFLGLAVACSPSGFADSTSSHPLATPGSYELHPTLELTLFAREPDVVDPVALTFDEFGRAYVVEMRDYPYGFGANRTPGGTIRLLEDHDGDGRADRSRLFAQNLSFPTSVAAWNGGVLVMAPPEILFLQDTDGDGTADRREVVIAGLVLGVTDSNANGLRWALDNWIHAVNGGNGGSAKSPTSPFPAVELRDRDFRFRPASGAIELTSHTGGGFGLVFDDWGRSFTPHNVNHLQQRIADADAFLQNPGLPPIETTHSISDHGDMARIFAISTAVTRPNHPEQAGYFSSSGSMGFLGHLGWPEDLPGSIFVCDVVGNLVHRDVLSPDGPILKGSRAPREQTREFFASRDHSFRPTGVELGPDGALYLLDMQRDVIEHPDYIPKKLLDTLDLRAGQDRGRIYRIAPRNWPKARELPGNVPVTHRVALLASPNQWTRLTAQRLIVTRQEHAAVPALESLAASPDPIARLHALWTLHGLNALPEPLLLSAIASAKPEVRANAVQMGAERFPNSKSVHDAIVRHVTDENAFVRFTALLALGSLPEPPLLPPVLETFWQDRAAPWMRRAALATLRDGQDLLVAPALLGQAAIRSSDEPAAATAFRELANLIGAKPATTDGSRLTDPLLAVLASNTVSASIQIAFLEGLLEGLERAGHHPTLVDPAIAALGKVVQTENLPLLAAAWRLARNSRIPDSPTQRQALEAAFRNARSTSVPLARRLDSVRLLDLATLSEAAPVLVSLLNAREPLAIQQAALELLRRHRDPVIAKGLVQAWSSLSPSLRAPVVNLLVYRPTFHEALLAGLESGAVQVGELNLDLEHRRMLLRRAAPDIRARASKFTSDEEYSNRKSTVDDWLAKIPAAGDPIRGRPTFERICAQCHRVGELGFRVGPDLSGMNHRSVEDILSNILDPNMAMNPAYVAFTAELDDGESETGIPVAESTEAVTLIQAGERRVTLPRHRLKRFQSEGKSLMPDGLEAGLSATDLRDLIAFLQESPAPKP